jgi:hypothetical protein
MKSPQQATIRVVHRRDATSRIARAKQLLFALEHPTDPAVVGRDLGSMRVGDPRFWAMVRQHRVRKQAKAQGEKKEP